MFRVNIISRIIETIFASNTQTSLWAGVVRVLVPLRTRALAHRYHTTKDPN